MGKDLKEKLCLFAMDLLDLAICEGYYDLPNISCRVNDTAIDYLVLYSEYELYGLPRVAICFYEYDDIFKGLVTAINNFRYTGETKGLEEYAERFKDAYLLIAPDITLCSDVPFIENLCRIYEARLISLFFINVLDKIVIPNISFVDEKTKEACFMGIDKQGIVAFNANHVLNNGEIDVEYLNEIADEIIARVSPKAVVIYNVSVECDAFSQVIKKFEDNKVRVILPDTTLYKRKKDHVYDENEIKKLKYDKEIECGFDALLDYCDTNPEGIYTLVYQDKKIETKFDTIWDDDNGLEMDDPDYEEYNSILFIDIKTGKGIPICYHDLPKEIWHNGKRIYPIE